MPSALLTVLQSLRFSGAQPDGLQNVNDAEWRKLLRLTDLSQLTLPLGVRCREFLPGWVRARIDGNLANNAIRRERIVETYLTLAAALRAREIEFVVLKGFSHFPLYCADLRHRPQYDLDFYCPPEHIERAYRALMELGYEPFGRASENLMDHLPPLILKTGWRPKDDYYDPDIPITIELHFRFWDRATERFSVSNPEGFWERRQVRQSGSFAYETLHPADGFSYAAWHLLRHLLRGDTRAYHVYEVAHFLHRTAEDDGFWRDWRDLRPLPLAETIVGRLAVEWFGCRANPVMRELMSALPAEVQRWFELFSFSPLAALERPNKDELFLHLCLLDRFHDRFQVVWRRLFPRRVHPYIADVHVASPDLRLRLKRRLVGAAFLVKRGWHHARALAPLAWNGMRWARALARLPRPRSGRTLRAETAQQ